MTVALAPNAFFFWVTPQGQPAVGYQLFTYVAGTSIPQATYTDSTQTQQNTNPVVLNAYGYASVWLVTGLTYKLILTDAAGNLVGSQDQIAGGGFVGSANLLPTVTNTYNIGSPALTWANSYFGTAVYIGGASVFTQQTPAEFAAGVMPVNYQYAPGVVDRYGTNTTPGTTDMTAAFNAALSQSGLNGGAAAYAPASGGPYLVAGNLAFVNSNSKLYGDGPATVVSFSNTAGSDSITATNLSNITVSDMKLVITGIQVTQNYQGVVAFRGCTNIRAQRLDVSGYYGSGIVVSACTTGIVEDNYCYGGLGLYGSNSDIHINATVTTACSAIVIANNRCYGGANDFGIALFNNGLQLAVTRCVIANNRIGQHAAYGILTYANNAVPTDCYHQIIGNYIENIQGVSHGNNNYGAGIYVASMGGPTITGNTIYNCCQTTSSGALAPSGIGINLSSGQAPFTISGNTILDMAQGNANNTIGIAGIFVTGTPTLGGTITGNTVSQQQSGALNVGIYVAVPNNVTVSGNTVTIANTIANTRGIFLYGASANAQNLNCNGNTIQGCLVASLEVVGNGANIITSVSINGNAIYGGANGCLGILVGNLAGASIVGNSVNCTNTFPLEVTSACSQTRISANTLTTTAAAALSFSGTCTGSLYDESNYASGTITNGATGLNVRQMGTASPAGGTYVLGDVVYNTAGVTPFAWQCTVAGSPGTWTGLTLP